MPRSMAASSPSPSPASPSMHLVTTVTEDHQVSLSLRREAYGETDRAEVVVLTVQQARAYAAQLSRAAGAAERQARVIDVPCLPPVEQTA